jgi:hypothetical protein
MSWLLVAAVAIPLALQARALRGRSYAVLSARSRQDAAVTDQPEASVRASSPVSPV